MEMVLKNKMQNRNTKTGWIEFVYCWTGWVSVWTPL